MFRPKLIVPVLFLALSLLLQYCESARILGFFPAPFTSHLIIHSAITDALAERGHNITIITTVPLIKPNPRYNHIHLDGCSMPKDYFNEKINSAQSVYQQFIGLTKIINDCCNNTLQHKKMKKLMAEEKFDLLILGYFFNDFQLGIGSYFKCPIVVSFMIQPIRFLHKFVGNPIEVAYVPNLINMAEQPMDFWQRLVNFLISEVFEPILFRWIMTDQQNSLYEQNFPIENFPSLEEAKKNVSLVLINHHFSQGPIRPNVPAMVEIGGIQIKEKPDPLPQDIKSIMDNAKNGIIYFSFGSNIQGEVDKSKSKIMFDILSKLPYTILWKWGSADFPGHCANVIYKKWLPQDDVLAHPNIKLFVTHGGQGSVVESLYHGVPMVGVPLFGEQHANIAYVQKKGYGRHVDFTTMTQETFGNAVNEVLTNEKYRNNVETFAKLYKDRPMSSKETAVFWVEYVLRHHGAPHMQSPAVYLNKFQLLSLDVIGFLLVVTYVVFKLIKICVLFVCSKCASKEKNKKE